MKILVWVVLLLFSLSMGCAEGGLSEVENQAPGDTAGGDSQPGDGEAGDGEAGDGEAGDGEVGDGEAGDGEAGDGETGDGDDLCDTPCASGVCDPSTGQCVDCMEKDHCAGDLVCDDSSFTCTECTGHDDCSGDQKCHNIYPVCVAECCQFLSETVFTNTGYAHDQFDIAVGSDGIPRIVFIDRGANQLRFAQRVGDNTWLSQNFASYTGNAISQAIRITLDDANRPHVVHRMGSQWNYHYQSAGGGGWMSEPIWNSTLSGASTADIALGTGGEVHFLTLNSADILYARRSSTGTWTRETLNVTGAQNLSWQSFGLLSDGSPVIAARGFHGTGNPTPITLFTPDSPTGWVEEIIVTDAAEVFELDVTPNDEILLVYHNPMVEDPQSGQTVHQGIKMVRNGTGSWVEEVVSTQNRAIWPYLVSDARGDAHIIYSISHTNTTSSVGYTRWDGDSWEGHVFDNSLIGRGFWQRIAVDENYIAHIVSYDSSAGAIAYLRAYGF